MEIESGIDFELQEMKRMELENIKKKCTEVFANGWKYVDIKKLTEREKKIYMDAEYSNEKTVDSYDEQKRIEDSYRNQRQIRDNYNYLNGTL